MARLSDYLRHHRGQIAAVGTPSAVSLLIVLSLLAAVLLIPDRHESRLAGAAQITGPPLQQAVPGRPITLRDRLVTGLQARLVSEVAFVDNLSDKVNKGKLPQRLVDETFFWARERAAWHNRRGRRRRPIIYFQPAMVARASRIGITL